MAWHFRRNIVEHESGKPFESELWNELLNAEHRITGLLDKQKLRVLYDRIFRRKFPGITMTIPDPSSFRRATPGTLP
jgi:hypothetical protein